MPARLVLKGHLDSAGCGAINCGHDHSVLYLHSVCHPRHPVEVRYEKSLGHLVVSCNKCGAEVVRIAVAVSVPSVRA